MSGCWVTPQLPISALIMGCSHLVLARKSVSEVSAEACKCSIAQLCWLCWPATTLVCDGRSGWLRTASLLSILQQGNVILQISSTSHLAWVYINTLRGKKRWLSTQNELWRKAQMVFFQTCVCGDVPSAFKGLIQVCFYCSLFVPLLFFCLVYLYLNAGISCHAVHYNRPLLWVIMASGC